MAPSNISTCKGAALDPSQYAVGWLCILECELRAARAMLDEIHDYISFDRDPNTYIPGVISGVAVVIACSGRAGNLPMSSCAFHMAQSFPNLRAKLLVGIGGGVPNPPKTDIRLGDVVVAAGPDAAVTFYGHGKLTETGHKATTRVDRPSRYVTSVVDIMRTERNKLVKHLGASAPDVILHAMQLPDILYEGADESRPVHRAARAKAGPAVHYGQIASGELVIKTNGTLRQEILDQIEGQVLCFEMEAAALMNDYSCLVVRGISDYCDNHKNDAWHDYAASAAAAYCKWFLSVMPKTRTAPAKPLQRSDSSRAQNFSRAGRTPLAGLSNDKVFGTGRLTPESDGSDDTVPKQSTPKAFPSAFATPLQPREGSRSPVIPEAKTVDNSIDRRENPPMAISTSYQKTCLATAVLEIDQICAGLAARLLPSLIKRAEAHSAKQNALNKFRNQLLAFMSQAKLASANERFGCTFMTDEAVLSAWHFCLEYFRHHPSDKTPSWNYRYDWKRDTYIEMTKAITVWMQVIPYRLIRSVGENLDLSTIESIRVRWQYASQILELDTVYGQHKRSSVMPWSNILEKLENITSEKRLAQDWFLSNDELGTFRIAHESKVFAKNVQESHQRGLTDKETLGNARNNSGRQVLMVPYNAKSE